MAARVGDVRPRAPRDRWPQVMAAPHATSAPSSDHLDRKRKEQHRVSDPEGDEKGAFGMELVRHPFEISIDGRLVGSVAMCDTAKLC